MNQILFKCSFESNDINNQIPSNKKNINKYYYIVIISIISIIVAIVIYFINKYNLFKNDMISKKLVSNYSIMTLYLNNTISDYSEIKVQDNDEPFIIGLIEIDKIKLTYPIISSTSDESLKISPCRFAGPMPNQVGNLCIAGHNYVDNRLFSKLNNLDINDIIKIFDLNGNYIEYKIYSKNEIEVDDLSCINQETNGLRIITLITCNNVNGKRLCIKAVEI